MRRSLIISGVAHAVVLAWGLVAFAARPNEAPPTEPLPVEFVSATEFSQLIAGVKNAPKPLEDAKPLADKVGEAQPVTQLAPKVAEKPEIVTDVAAKREPKPEPKKAESKPAEKPKQPAIKPDQIAEELKKDEAKKAPKPEQKKESRPSPKFDANQVAALLDKREPQRQVATAETLNGAASLGAANGHAAQLSQSELDALRARLSQCWSPPAGVDVSSDLFVVLHVLFKSDGSLASEPAVVESSTSALGPALAESAKRALLLCQPFTMLKPEHYDQWKDIEVKFDPHELLGG
jgi:outer membrane biosynthesis protein TonB